MRLLPKGVCSVSPRVVFILGTYELQKSYGLKKREYRDGIKSKETRPGWGEAHNVYKACVGITEEF